jgi:hypothetical protein
MRCKPLHAFPAQCQPLSFFQDSRPESHLGGLVTTDQHPYPSLPSDDHPCSKSGRHCTEQLEGRLLVRSTPTDEVSFCTNRDFPGHADTASNDTARVGGRCCEAAHSPQMGPGMSYTGGVRKLQPLSASRRSTHRPAENHVCLSVRPPRGPPDPQRRALEAQL